MPNKLLIIAHCPSPNTQLMANGILEGARSIAESERSAVLKSPFACHAEDVLQASAVILFTTENFGYMNGALKDLFERIYYPCLEDQNRNQAKPYSLIIKAGMDGTGADTSVNKIVTGLKWRKIQETLLCKGDFNDAFVSDCRTMGKTMQAMVDSQLI
ncbi:NAD(P)H-dependent oxidoreductase [Arenicella sp. 4NH20-0111]|uniref:flavodoxin family protein n=1 Tax=Arenicella sp. 4NH20-0111 TaxID=3127648 RepID=UPI003103087A